MQNPDLPVGVLRVTGIDPLDGLANEASLVLLSEQRQSPLFDFS